MGAREYGHYCAIAKALDVLGDRWALLLVRELLFGPQRYSDLQARLPGISTDMLATRLRELEHHGVVRRSGDDRSYELSERGAELGPVLEALAVWGLAELGKRTRAEPFDPRWLTIPLRGLVRPERAADIALTVRFVIDDDEILLSIDHGRVTLPSEGEHIDVTVTGPPDALAAAIARPGSESARRLQVTGDPRSVQALLHVLGLTDDPPAQATPKRRRSTPRAPKP